MRALHRPDVRLAALAWLTSGVAICAIVGLLLQPESALHGTDDGVELVMVRGHSLHMPFHVAWALEGLRAHAGRAVALLAGFLGAVTALVLVADDGRRPGPSPWLAVFWGAFGGAALSVFLPVDEELNRAFGDGSTLPTNVGGGAIFGAEIGTSLVYQLVLELTRRAGSSNALDALRLVDTLGAAAFGGSLAHLAWTHDGSRRDRLVLGLGLLSGGAGLQLLGYVETTQVLLAATATYLAGAIALADRRGGQSTLVLTWAAIGMAVIAHGAGVLLGPSSLYLLLRSRGQRLSHFLGGIALVVVPVAFVVLPRWLEGDIGNANGGGDANRWVPLDFDPYDLPSDCVYYGLFDWLHFVDLGNAVLVSCPVLVPALVIAVLGGPTAAEALRSGGVRLAAWAALGCFIIPFFWNHDFGMWGDWNLASSYLFPAHVFSWLVVARTLSPLGLTPSRYLACVLPLFLLQAVGTLGLALQLY